MNMNFGFGYEACCGTVGSGGGVGNDIGESMLSILSVLG